MPELRFPQFRDLPWKQQRLEDVAPLQRGFDLTSSEIEMGDVPVVYSNGIQNFHAVGMAVAPGLVTGRSGTIGKLHFIEEGDYWPHNTALWVTSFKGNLPKFVYYLFASIGIERFASGSGVPTLNRNDVHDFCTSLPSSVAEQQTIAECLSTLDELIVAENQKLDALKTHKKGLIQQLFPREGETLPRLRFSEFQNESEWELSSIQILMDKGFITGHLDGNHGELYPRAEEFSSSGVPYIAANDFAEGFVDFASCRHLPEARASIFRKGVAKDGDILFAHNATVGPVAKLTTALKFVILSTTATYFRCDPSRLVNDFLKCALTSPGFVNQYSRVMAQSTRNQVPITAQRKLILQIPSVGEQQRIASCLSSLDALIADKIQKLEALKAHKNGLMQQLLPPRGH